LAGADLGVNLHGNGPESHRVLLEARPKRLLAFANAEVPESAGMPAWRPHEHEVRRWCRLLEEAGIRADPSRLELPRPAQTPVWDVPTTIVHPGSADPARRWPVERFAAVVRAEREAGRRVIVTGSAAEDALAAEVARLAGLDDGDVYAGKTDLLGLAAVVAAAARVVCGDTGVAHLATALGTPSVVLFGPMSPEYWGPPAERREHRVLWAGEIADMRTSAPHPALLLIDVADVLHELAELDRIRRAA